MENAEAPKCQNLVLDAGPLLSLSPLRGLAEKYLTVPQVLSELKDNRAREHFERLGLMSGTKVEVRSPDAASLAHVIQWAKKTGDYSVLSHADLCVLALTYALHEEDRRLKEKVSLVETITASDVEKEEVNDQASGPPDSVKAANPSSTSSDIIQSFERFTLNQVSTAGTTDTIQNKSTENPHENEEEKEPTEQDSESVEIELTTTSDNENEASTSVLAESAFASSNTEPSPLTYDDPSDTDDDEGEWITPLNVSLHKSRALDLLPDSKNERNHKGKNREAINSGCMTADFAMQNVLLQMDLNLVGLEGKRIERVKTWVLRCHACFKICKDNTKKFCPTCGNNTLLRASVTISSPTASASVPAMQVHLKPNFQYRVRGTKYSIPQPKHGSAKTGPGTGLVLREDQVEYMRAKKMADGKREREETKLMKGILAKGIDANGMNAGVSSWMDPDWIPEIVSVGSGGKGRTVRSSRMDGDLPQIGYGRKNPNERRRRK